MDIYIYIYICVCVGEDIEKKLTCKEMLESDCSMEGNTKASRRVFGN